MLHASLLLIAQSTSQAGTYVYVQHAAEFRRAVEQAKPGTTIELAPEIFEGGLYASNVHGTKEKPITIRGKGDGRNVLNQGGAAEIHLSSVSHTVLQNLNIANCTANGINIDDGGNR